MAKPPSLFVEPFEAERSKLTADDFTDVPILNFMAIIAPLQGRLRCVAATFRSKPFA